MLMMTPPLAVPSSLVRTMPVIVGGFFEDAGLLQAVLAGGRVQHQEGFMRRVGLLADDHPADFF